jgi:predicted nucleic acid-binding protein
LKYLVDTNVISEVRKGTRCSPPVAAWFSGIADDDVYVSVLLFGEIRKGIERLNRLDPSQATAIEAWLADLQRLFGDRVLLIDRLVAEEWGRMNVKRSVPVIDALLAATAKVNGMTFATRNTRDVADLGVDLIDPFAG